MSVIAKWKLSGGVWTDVSGNGYTLTATGVTQAAGHGGGANKSAHFNRGDSTDKLVRSHATAGSLRATGTLTLRTKLKMASRSNGNAYFIASKWGNTGNLGYALWVHTDGKLGFRVSKAGSAAENPGIFSSTIISAGTWYDGVAIYDLATDTLYMYMNAASDATPVAANCNGIYDSSADFIIGNTSVGGSQFDGDIDDFIVCDHMPSLTEIQDWNALGDDFVGVYNVGIALGAGAGLLITPGNVIPGTVSLDAGAGMAATGGMDYAESVALGAGAGLSTAGDITKEESISLGAGAGFQTDVQAIFDAGITLDSGSALQPNTDYPEEITLGTETGIAALGGIVLDDSIALGAGAGLTTAGDIVAGTLSGTISDRIGATINCSLYNVRINVYPVNNTNSAPLASILCTSSVGQWTVSQGISAGVKYLVTFEFSGTYTPLGEADIADAEYMTAA